MIFEALPIPGAFLVALESRGFFARLWCREEFVAQGIHADLAQVSVSHNATFGTVRAAAALGGARLLGPRPTQH